MADIFISYSQRDRAWVRTLVDALTAEGYRVWWDLEIHAGESFDRAIERSLSEVGCVVAVWSQQARDSDWVRAESAWAKGKKKLVSIRIQNDLELPIEFFHVHTDNFVDWDGSRSSSEFRKLVSDIREMAGPPVSASEPARGVPPAQRDEAPTPNPSPASKTAPVSRSKSEASTEPRSPSSVPKPLFTLRRQGAVVVVISLAVATLAGGIFYVGHDRRAPAPGSVFRDILQDGSEGPEMVVVPAGTFQMGCVVGERCPTGGTPVHSVTFDRNFAIGKTEVTFDQWGACVKAAACSGEPWLMASRLEWGFENRPVIYVSWDDAQEYASWLSEKTGKSYRLPTEAEWEHAARAGTDTAWSFGSDQSELTQHAWYHENAELKTHPVGEKDPNPWGLNDVHGNVWEWVQDCWNDSYQGAPADGTAWENGDCARRVVRGGAWRDKPGLLRSGFRHKQTADFRYYAFGFRLAQDLDE